MLRRYDKLDDAMLPLRLCRRLMRATLRRCRADVAKMFDTLLEP